MAIPRVFVSSTCYDLSQVRGNLVDFIRSYGFEAVLSERGDVFYHPDIHTQEGCINEIGHCHLVLIIGGRFGGEYVADQKKSIENAEYYAAREQKIPVFTFVRSNVYADHHLYSKNKQNKALPNIVFPSIDDQKRAIPIFKFIDEVRLAPVNNGLFSFDYTREIIDLLRKQWAGLFYDFIEQRSDTNQLKAAANLLNNISIAGDKVEELVKALYRHLDEQGADAKIVDVEQRATAREFFENIVSKHLLSFFTVEYLKKQFLETPREGEWYEYQAQALGGKISRQPFPGVSDKTASYLSIDWDGGGVLVENLDEPSDKINKNGLKQKTRFEVLKEMDASSIAEVLDEVFDD